MLGRSFFKFFVSMRLTVVLLALSLVIVFVATLDQVNLGVWGVQQKYFRSFFVMTHLPGSDFPIPIFPGGYFIGGLLMLNLIAAHFYRFRLSWKKSGIVLTHFGLILLLVGELLSGLAQKEYSMRLDEGQTRNYAESFRDNELVLVDTTDPLWDQVVSIPEKRLEHSEPLQHPKLPFRVAVKAYYPNAVLQMRSGNSDAGPTLATAGIGGQVNVMPAPRTYKENERDTPAAFVELQSTQGSLGTWLVSPELADPQTFTFEGHTWKIALRVAREYMPFSLTLQKLAHDVYPGSDIPKNFSSKVHLKSDDGAADRTVLIYMNNPLRYGGLTFYQYQMDAANRNSVLEVVRNPSWLFPYVACALMGLGLLVQFGLSLTGFVSKHVKAA